MSTAKLTAKQSVLLKKLITRLTDLSQFMQAQGLSTQDVNEFILRCVFEVQCSQETRCPQLSKDFSSETEEQTNSEASEWSAVEIGLQKVLMQKVTEGIKMDKILVGYLERCCVEEDKLKNYLKSQQVQQPSKHSVMDFQRLKQKIGLSKHRKPRYQPASLFQSPQPRITSHISSIHQRIQLVKHRSAVEQSQRELEYMRSFEKSLTESIRKTKLLRSMLEKQLANEISPLNMLRGDDEEIGREIY